MDSKFSENRGMRGKGSMQLEVSAKFFKQTSFNDLTSSCRMLFDLSISFRWLVQCTSVPIPPHFSPLDHIQFTLHWAIRTLLRPPQRIWSVFIIYIKPCGRRCAWCYYCIIKHNLSSLLIDSNSDFTYNEPVHCPGTVPFLINLRCDARRTNWISRS